MINRFTNTENAYGWIAIAFHWVTAIFVFVLFGLGLWLDRLGYYDPLYRTIPAIHKGLGFFLVLIVLARLFWKLKNIVPIKIPTHKKYEVILARVVHVFFYIALVTMFVSGYLVTTAAGQSFDVFGWFALPAVVTSVENLEDFALEIHEWLAWGIISIAVLHALAALKHHFIDKDSTLKRMLGLSKS